MSANLSAGTALIFFAICLPFVAPGRRAHDLRRLIHPQLSRGSDLPHHRPLGTDLAHRFCQHLLAENPKLIDVHPIAEPALLMTSVLKDEAVAARDVWVSAAASLAVALVLMVLTARQLASRDHARIRGITFSHLPHGSIKRFYCMVV